MYVFGSINFMQETEKLYTNMHANIHRITKLLLMYTQYMCLEARGHKMHGCAMRKTRACFACIFVYTKNMGTRLHNIQF